jgi:hypothetical protein
MWYYVFSNYGVMIYVNVRWWHNLKDVFYVVVIYSYCRIWGEDAVVVLLQVWFQNKRSKERRLKQLTSMGRGPFFGSSRKMRGFPMNLSPGGLDEAPPGFPYFTTADGKFEFGYGAPAGFHHEFFPGHHPHQGPPGQPLPFNPPGEETVTQWYNSTEINHKFLLIHCVFDVSQDI